MPQTGKKPNALFHELAIQRIFRIGTRASLLATTQARQVKRLLELKNPGARFELVTVKTTGDQVQTISLFNKNNIGVFTKELEKKLLEKKIDLVVHSLKDLPTRVPKNLVLGAFPKRLASHDTLVSRKQYTLKTLPVGAKVGTGSPRRKRQIATLRPDLQLVDLRGNLDTRVQKVISSKKLDAVVVAEAGLKRIGKYLHYAKRVPFSQILPAVGQAALAIELRKEDKETRQIVKKINHRGTEMIVLAERRFLQVLEGGCRVPVGAHCFIKNHRMFFKAAVFSAKSTEFLKHQISGPVSQYKKMGEILAKRLIAKGALFFLREARANGVGR